eukprot:3749020-Prorocentrum_lima.AAC.1
MVDLFAAMIESCCEDRPSWWEAYLGVGKRYIMGRRHRPSTDYAPQGPLLPAAHHLHGHWRPNWGALAA